MEANQTLTSPNHSLSEEEKWSYVKGLACRLSVEIPIQGLTVGKLIELTPGVVLDTQYDEGSHVPVLVNGEMIAWGEFDVVEERLAIRLTELA
jgi:flagellar motor switch protein FliN/FliY